MTARTQLNAKIQELKAQIKELAQTEFKTGAADLFAKFEALNSFSWQQYTPHFNDGDECTFSVHKDEPRINGYRSYSCTRGEGKNILASSERENGWPRKINPDYDPKCAEITKAVDVFLGQFDEDNYKDMFGDHAQVTISRTGVDIAGYDHD